MEAMVSAIPFSGGWIAADSVIGTHNINTEPKTATVVIAGSLAIVIEYGT